MGSQLEDALRAAAAAARRPKRADPPPAKAAAPPVATAAAVSVMASPGGNDKKRPSKRRRSRSDSMASEDDPAKRIAAFQKRMFDVGTGGSASSAAVAGAAKSADEIVKVQWKTKAAKRTNGLANLRENDDDDDAVPQLTRARAVATPVPQTAGVAVKSDTKKKTKKKKKKTMPRVTTVEPPLALMPTTTTRAPVGTSRTTASAPARRDDDALEFSDPSENDDTESTTNGMALAGAKVAARNAQQVKVPTAAKPVRKGTRLVKLGASSAVAASPLRKPPVAQRVQNGVSTHKTSSSAQAASNGKMSDPNTLDRSGDQPLKKPATMMTKTLSSPPRGDADDDDDKWDLDALVKKTVGKAVGKKTDRAKPVLSVDDADGDVADPEDADHDDSDSEFVGKQFRNHQMHLFSQLIDEAARERWELVEVGRLVRIFAAQWGHKKKKTARFLRRCCPELVSVEFLEGMNIPLDAKQLLKIFERGSGTPVVVMNKIASAVENGNMTVRDEDLQSFIVDQTQLMPTNRDIIEFLLPLLESLSKVKDVGVLLKAICEHWHVDRTVALVQDILLTPVFDDLDGQPDVILEDLPALEGRLDFPSCMDDEDADENGNLKGLIVGEESDLGESDAHPEDAAEEELGEIESDDDDGNDSHAEDGVYEGETDSEEEREAQERMNPTKRRRSRFILDEADEDDEGDDGSGDDFLADEDEGEDDDSDSSGDSSDDEGASTKPQRKRLRKG